MTPARAATVGALLAGGALGSGVAFAATGATAGASPGTAMAGSLPASLTRAVPKRSARHGRRPLLPRRVVGKVVSDSASGGVFGQGRLVIAQPDGTQTSFSLSNESHAARYQGLGHPVVREAPSTLPAGEVVVVFGAQVEQGSYWAARILDSGFTAR
jgi:hypothetical protein